MSKRRCGQYRKRDNRKGGEKYHLRAKCPECGNNFNSGQWEFNTSLLIETTPDGGCHIYLPTLDDPNFEESINT